MYFDQKFNKLFIYGDMKESTHYSLFENPLINGEQNLRDRVR